MASLTCNKSNPQSALNSLAENYNYDAVDQLIEAKYGTARTVGYQYDAVGNRQWVSDNGTTAHYTANSDNGYTSVDGVSTETDLNGNMVSVPGAAYAYDAQNRISSATVNGVTTEFTYDSRNRVVQRTSGNGTLNLTYSGWNLIEERNGGGELEQVYVHGAGTDEILVKITATGPAYYHHDGLGSTIALTGENGELLESYRYDAFGAASVYGASGSALPASPRENRFLFTGREWLSQVGLYDYRNRVYSAQIGRFLQTDPIRFAAGDVNIYRYVSNNPINMVDPWGLDGEIVVQRNPSGPSTVTVKENGRTVGQFPGNANGYIPNGRGGALPNGDYILLPKPESQMYPPDDPRRKTEYPLNTPSITKPGMEPGRISKGWSNLRVHGESSDGSPDSNGCLTGPGKWPGIIQDIMMRNLDNGGTRILYR